MTTIVALSYTKLRTAFGVVGIEIDEIEKIAYVRLAKIWSRDDMNSIGADMKKMNDVVKWDMTFADQLIGQHLIRSIEQSLRHEVYTITTQKNLKDPENVELIKVMDMTEITQLTLSLKQDHQIQFPPDKKTKDMKDLIAQIEMFTEFTTEQGTVSYYAPGEEMDCLTRALMICIFGGRQILKSGLSALVIVQGSHQRETAEQSFAKYFKQALGDDFVGLSNASLNRTDKFEIIKRNTKKF